MQANLPEPAHFLSAQMVLVRTFFQLGMYNLDVSIEFVHFDLLELTKNIIWFTILFFPAAIFSNF